MNVQDLLAELARRNITLYADDGELVIEAPRGSLTDWLRATLRECKQALLELLRAAAPVEMLSALIPRPEQRHQPFPLTEIQQAYCVGRTSAVYLGQVGCHYYQELDSAGLDLERLERSFQQLVRHHDMLRAIVHPDGRQQVRADLPAYRFETLDLRGQAPEAAAAALTAIRRRLAHQVFAPEQWPLFAIHATLFDGGRLRLALSFDLLMIDAQSLTLLIHDWERLYHANGPAPKRLELSFRDYVLWDRDQRQTERYRQALAYWEGRLATLPAAPDLPARPGWQPPLVEPFVRRKGRLSAESWSRLKARAKQRGLTPSALVCAVFAEVLGSWSSLGRFTLNLTFCRRRPAHADVGRLLGDFTSTILLEVDRAASTFAERAGRLQTQLAADLEHVAVSGVEVLRRASRAGGGVPLMPVVFTSLLGHADQRPEVLFSSNWLGDIVYGISQTPQVSLDHQAWEEGDALVYHWDTRETEYPDGAIEAMFAAYGEALARLAEADTAWDDPALSLVPAAQVRRRSQVNASRRPVSEALLQTLFLEQAAARPKAPAVISPGKTLTYEELEQRTRALAWQLHRQGAGPGQRVAIVMHKGWEQVVAALAILRAGAAYLPVDAGLPAARRNHLLRHGEVSLVLTQTALADRIDWPSGISVVSVNEAATGEEPGLLPPCLAGPDDLAYVIYTSGTTGQPKGVMISHRGAVNTLLDVNERFRVSADDRVLAVSSLSFDLSVYDVFGLLSAGGAVVMPPASADRDPQVWCECIRAHRVTIWNSVPALMELLAVYAVGRPAQRPSTLRLALLSGDWIPLALPAAVRACAGENVELISLGGATEASIWSVLHPIGTLETGRPSVPYGKPMSNQSLYVLDRQLRPCPDWVTGDLYIGGVGLALGYWRDVAETNSRFLVHPRLNQRLYRTGDLARYLPDGNLELIGRDDFQVKIQGHRIELGEIECVLASHPGVRAAVVVGHDDGQGSKRLIAYVVPAGNGLLSDPEELRAFLAARLPRYMVPSVFLPLEALPLSANGKVDRGLLPSPGQAARRHPADPTAEPMEGERPLLAIVRDVLGMPNVGVEDNLVDLGCTSLQTVQIHRRIQETLGHDFPVAEMFNHPNVRSLAARVSAGAKPSVALAACSSSAQRNRAELARRRQGLHANGERKHAPNA